MGLDQKNNAWAFNRNNSGGILEMTLGKAMIPMANYKPLYNYWFGTTGGKLKVWVGSTWAPLAIKVWSGSKFIEKPLKRWNGSSWILI